MTRKLGSLIAALLVLGVLGACSGSDAEMGTAARSEAEALRPKPRGVAFDMAAEGNGGAGGGSLGDTSSYEAGLPPVGPAVIKTGDLTLRVDEDTLQDVLSRAVDVARSHGGFVLSTSVEEEGARGGIVVMRVPAEAFEDALADARDLGEVVRESVSGEDVSQEFVDLEARLRNFEAQESVLLDLMAESSSVADTLRVQRELQDVQLEIERLRGRLRYLRDQTDLSTITLRVREADAVAAGTGLIERAWRRSVDVFNAIVSAIVVGLSVALPIGLFVLLLLVIARMLRLRLPSSLRPRA